MTDTPAGPATTLTVERGVATITLDRPDARNSLSAELVESLGDHLEDAFADDAARVVVLTNAGTTFCAGADLKSGAARSPRRSLVDVLTTMLDSPKPVVGRIAGQPIWRLAQTEREVVSVGGADLDAVDDEDAGSIRRRQRQARAVAVIGDDDELQADACRRLMH